MRDRPLHNLKHSVARRIRFSVASMKVVPPPWWAIASVSANVALVLVLGTTAWRMMGRNGPGSSSQASVSTSHLTSRGTVHAVASESAGLMDDERIASEQLGPRHQLTYGEWVDILTQEAQAVVQNPPPALSILMGDSISLWFPHEQLPKETTWLNQGISGEVSEGLLNRLDIIADTQPDYIFVMIGINDLLRDVSDRQLLDNQQQIIRELAQMHPSATIVLQSILPHSAENATWEGKERLLAISNDRIRALNEELEAIAIAESVQFLDLTPLFSDRQGNLPMALSTDGLHLNNAGYTIWSNALQVYQQAIAFD